MADTEKTQAKQESKGRARREEPTVNTAEEAAKKSEELNKDLDDSLQGEGKEAAENAEEAIVQRAEAAAATDPRVGHAARERVRASHQADVNAVSRGEEAGGASGKARRGGHDTHRAYTALHAMVRDGEAVHPGDEVTFRANEGEHVAELLAQGMIAEGTGKEAERRLREADLARAEAVGPTSNW